MKAGLYWKAADPQGWDFYSHKTINYRENIGKIVKCPDQTKDAELCSSSVIHACKKPNNMFISAGLPLTLFRVRGVPVVSDSEKSGFKQFEVLEEVPQDKIGDVFGWNYLEACNPLHPLKIKAPVIGNAQILLLQNWASVWASVWDSVGAYIGSLFPKIKTWKYTPKTKGYPYQSCADLWRQGIVPSFDGKTWRLHAGLDAKIAFEISNEKLRGFKA